MKSIANFFEKYGMSILLSLGTLLLVSFPLWFRLGSLTGGLSADEFKLHQQITGHEITFSSVLHAPFFLPYKLGLFLLQYVPFHGAGSLRSLSVLLGLAGIIGFYYVVRTWYSERLAVIATLLFATSSWLLHLARYASVDCLYIFLILILASWTWLKKGSSKRTAFFVASMAATVSLYIPGFIWFIVPAVFWQRKTIARALRHVPYKILVPSALAVLILLTPLIIAVVDPAAPGTSAGMVRRLFGLPNALPSIQDFFANLGSIPLHIFITGSTSSLLSIGKLPLLDVFTAAMTLIGLVVSVSNWRLDRSKLILFILVAGSILNALGGAVHISLLLPFVYLLAAEGLAYLLNQWLTVFPRNPFARSVGVAIVALAVGVACFYQLSSYFTAWPHTETAKRTFTRQL